MKGLNMGGGLKRIEGYLNLDKLKLDGVEVVHDLNKFPYPFDDNEFDEILCDNILEHLDDVSNVMGEMHRILKTGGLVKIKVPHFTSANAFHDPTHKNFFTHHTFDYFTSEHSHSYYFNFRYKILKKRINFAKKRCLWNYLIEPLANKFPHLYENTFLRVFPALSLDIVLQKI